MRNVVVGFVDSAFNGEVKQKISTFVKTVKNAFTEFKGIDTSGLTNIIDKIKARFEPLTVLAEGIRKAFSAVATFIKKVAPVFSALIVAVGEGLSWLSDKATTALENAKFDSVGDIINTILAGGLVVGITKLIKSFSNISESAKGFLDSIIGVLDGVKGTLEAYQESLKANVLLKIASAIAILAVSLIALSLVDSDNLSMALTAVTAMFAELFGSMAIFEKTMGAKGFATIGRVTTAMLKLSVSILVLSIAMKELAKLDWEGIVKGLVGVAGMSLIMVASAKLLSTSSGKLMKGSTGLILFATSMVILANAVEKLGKLNKDELTKGLIGVGVLCAELVLFLKVADLDGKGLIQSAGLVALAGAVNILAIAVKTFSTLDTNALIKGLAAVGVVLTEIALFTKLTGNSANLTATAVGMTVLGAALLIFTEVISGMGALSWEEIGKGLLTMAGALLSVSIATKLMNNAVTGATSVLIVSASLVILAEALKSFTDMDLPTIGKGLLALAGVFGVLGVAGYLLGGVAPAILTLSYAIGVLGIAVAAVGAGVAAFSAGIYLLEKAGPGGVEVFVAIVEGLIALIPTLIQAIGEGIITFAQVVRDLIPVVGEVIKALVLTIVDIIAECLPVIISAVLNIIGQILQTIVSALPNILSILGTLFISILNGLRVLLPEFSKFLIDVLPIVTEALITIFLCIIQVVNEVAPDLIECVLTLLRTLLTKLDEFLPNIIEAGVQIILGLLKGISDNIDEVIAQAIDVVISFIEGVASKMDDIIQAGCDLIISFINGIAEAIETNTEPLFDAVDRVISAIIDAIVLWFTRFNEKGKEIVDNIMAGISAKWEDAKAKIKEFMNNMVTAIKDKLAEWKQAGKDMIDGFIQGVKDKATALYNSAKEVVTNAVNGVKDFLGIHSPSKVFAEMGRYSDEGFIVGLKSLAGKVASSAEGVGEGAVEAMSNSIANISDIINGEMESDPVIRPVLDLSNIKAGTKSIDAMFSRNHAMTVGTSMNKTAQTINETKDGVGNQNGATYQFTQNNYSPKSLSRLEIYRQTKNQFSALKEVLEQ